VTVFNEVLLLVAWFYSATSNTLKMGTGLVPEKLKKLHILTRLSAPEHFVEARNTLSYQ
jgi:hypothetical protein